MSVIFEINRDFPYQMSLAFDEAAMEVLEWLQGSNLVWDMYIDLPENSVRYYFRTAADASAFKQQFGDAAEGRAVAGAK